MQKKVGFWSQVALIFFIVSGGPYGLESAVAAVGAGWTFVLLLAVPLLWALPTTLMVAELSSMMSDRGGYYIWVREGLGRFWGFQEGWWTICYSVVDLAIYPVLFVTYLGFFWPKLTDMQDSSVAPIRFLIAAAFVLAGILMNLRGSHWIGRHKIFEIILVGLPFTVLIIFGFNHGSWENIALAFEEVFNSQKTLAPSQLAGGLAILIWNFTGWDNATTYCSEVKDSRKIIPRSMLVALPLVMLFYLLPIVFGYKASIDPHVWGDSSGWPEIASRLAGPGLGAFTACVAVISAWALFNSQLLYITRLPAAMAQDQLLPKIFAKETKNTEVPVVSLLIAGLVALAFSNFSLSKLVIVDILLYSLGLMLEFTALVAFRIKKPKELRNFRIPLNTVGVVLMSLVPMSVALIVAVSSVFGEGGSYVQVSIAAVAGFSGPLIYWFLSRSQ